ncbi:MAG: hypothetical protein ROO76_07930 [Terriglobia bacterium]|nr:hypothetical protein [Terriglobia bacterium]
MKSSGSETKPRRFAGVRVLCAYLVVPNLLFWLAGHVLETLPRAAINLDYLLVAVLAPFLKKWQATALMTLALLVDVARCLGPLYYFSQRDALTAIVFLREVSLSHVLLSTVVVVAPAILLGWALVSLGGSRLVLRQKTAWMACLLVVLSAVGVWGGNSSLRLRDEAVGLNLCTSAGASMAKTIASAMFREHDRLQPIAVDSATREAGWFTGVPKTHDIVLIVLESGGEAINPQWKSVLGSVWSDPKLQEKYRVSTGAVPFTGATVPGEFRELCGVVSAVIEKPTDDPAVMNNCLPWQMKRAGMKTLYVHGFASEMFNRRDWVGGLGFDEELFHPQLHDMGLPDCGGAFRGICDASIAHWIGDQLVADPGHRKFIYWLTLNSHLPVTRDPEASNLLKCGTAAALIADNASCDLIGLQLRATRSIAEMVMRPDLPNTEFVIVGDHAPPFIFKERRDYFSQKEVPWVHLVPR